MEISSNLFSRMGIFDSPMLVFGGVSLTIHPVIVIPKFKLF